MQNPELAKQQNINFMVTQQSEMGFCQAPHQMSVLKNHLSIKMHSGSKKHGMRSPLNRSPLTRSPPGLMTTKINLGSPEEVRQLFKNDT